MLGPFLLLFGAICNLLSAPLTHAESIAGIANQFKSAQFIQDNAEALNYRLALLDNAATGSRIRIATYTFEDGKATQALAVHMCSAVSRGVSVELIADSKSGEIAGQENPFNASNDIKKNEAALMGLANCGVQVVIHNYTTGFVNVSWLGLRIPNIFDSSVKDGSTVSPLTLLNHLSGLRAQLVNDLHPILVANKITADPSSLLGEVQSLTTQFFDFIGQARTLTQDTGEDEAGRIEALIEPMRSGYSAVINDGFWSQFDPKQEAASIEKARAIKKGVVSALSTDPVLKNLRDKIRVFNRLNHRKLFMVQEPSGESCVIIGGRNLGDNYLTNGEHTYRDGDVFICNNHVASLENFLKQANDSMDKLKADLSDSTLDSPPPNVVVALKATKKVEAPRLAAVAIPVLKGDSLGEINDPLLLTAEWNPATDGVHMAMLEAVLRERKEIYIETPYAELNFSLRKTLEKAMRDNGVHVHIVTNSLFMSDGQSLLIRFWMAKWNYEMEKKYTDLFQVDFAPLSAGHMIHFKGAGFRCQAGPDKAFYRQYIVGSHNFHPRSGYSDKEHAIEWRVPTTNDCPTPASDLISLRMGYYKTQRELSKATVLRTYESLYAELQEVSYRFDDPANSLIARAILQVAYSGDNLAYPDRLNWIQTLMNESGMHDLIGILL